MAGSHSFWNAMRRVVPINKNGWRENISSVELKNKSSVSHAANSTSLDVGPVLIKGMNPA